VGRIFLDRERRLGFGWRLLCYLTLVVAATAGVAAVLAGSDPPVGRNLLAHLVAVALVVAITWLYRHQVDRRSWRDLGLPLPGRPQLVAAGASFALGTLTIVAFFGVLRALGWACVDGGEVAERGVAGALALLASGLVMYAASALVQELAFRGYFYQNLAERLPSGPPPSSQAGTGPWTTCSRWTRPPDPTTATRWSTPASAAQTCCLASTAAWSCCTR
jgi:membrane protease YdiL (CAAX protease family)